MGSNVTTPALTAGTVLRRPDGAFVLVETQIDRASWGCDLLEDREGHPHPLGNPGCHGLRISTVELLTYDRLDGPQLDDRRRLELMAALHEASDFADAEANKRDASYPPADRLAWAKMSAKMGRVIAVLYGCDPKGP